MHYRVPNTQNKFILVKHASEARITKNYTKNTKGGGKKQNDYQCLGVVLWQINPKELRIML